MGRHRLTGRRPVARRVARALAVAAALVAVFLAAVAWRVHSRVLASLRPPRLPVGAPAGLDGVTELHLTASDGVAIRGWYVPSRNHAAVVIGHGWAGERAEMLPEARALASRGYGVALFDWRGHGESGGVRTTWGVDEQRDLDAVLRYLAGRPDVDPARIGALGFSMGGMVVTQVAERDPRVRAVAVEGSHGSLDREMRFNERHWGWWSGSVAVWTLRGADIAMDRERPIDALCRISPRPLLIVAGTADADLPVDEARAMYDAACEPKQLVVVPNATHGAYVRYGGPEFERRLAAFFDAALLRPAVSPTVAQTP